MFNCNLKKTIASAIFLSSIVGSSIVTIIPAHAVNNTKAIVISSQLEDRFNIEQADQYFQRALKSMDDKNFDNAQKELSSGYNFINKVKDSSLKQVLNTRFSSLQDKICECQANHHLRNALLNINKGDISKAHLDLITAFNYGNEIADGSLRQPLVSLIIKVQNQITIFNK